ncbi:hypothetical protein GP486_000573 [Trichoglossum hirsutum]|uniref:Uncharacterized protein n=1 Tax=Trichoglossum hirsutum TaxID=265104 RepID=A0A9P8RTF3_9PEZI|nr:hypothetical protein GP486_000573 [Trichoglossum hirsutum]
MPDHPFSEVETVPLLRTMSRSPSEEQGLATQSWNQLESSPQGDGHSNTTPNGQTQLSLKRKQRASAQDWFEERQSQKLKTAASDTNGIQPNTTITFTSRDPRLRSTEQGNTLPKHTTLSRTHFHQSYSHTHPASNQTDQSPSHLAASSRMSNWRSGEQFNRREFGDTGRRSPPRDPRISHGQDRRTSYPQQPPPPPSSLPPWSGGRRNSADRSHYDRRSPPPSRRDEDRDHPRDHREYRDRNDRSRLDTSSAPTGPRGAKQMPGPYKPAPNQLTLQGYSNKQGYSSQQVNQFRTADPRLAGRIDGRPGPVTEGGPSSAMDVDFVNATEGGPDTRSGSRTPNTPSTPSFGPPRQKNELHSVLQEFSNRTSQLSLLEMKREAAVRELIRQAQAFEHSRRYHERFPSLSEQQANNKSRAQRDLDELNRKVKEEETARNRIIEAIASRVTPSGPSPESESIRRFEKDLSDVKTQVASHKSPIGQIPAVQRDLKKVQSQFMEMQSQFPETDQPKGLNIAARVDKIQQRLDEFPNLRLDVDKIREELLRVIGMLERQNKEFKELKNTVEGEDGKDGLLKFVAELEKSNAGIGEVVNQAALDIENLEKVVNTIQKLGDAHKTKEGADAAMLNAPNATMVPLSDEPIVTEIQQRLADFSDKLENARGDIADIISAQPDRDEAILSEIERVSKTSEGNSTKLETSLKEARQSHSEAISRLDSSISQILSSISDIKVKINTTPPPAPSITPANATQPPVVGIGRREYEHNLTLHSSRTDDLQRRIGNIEVQLEANTQSLQHLDSRYNNLTTERLAKDMVGQLHIVYPSVGNAQQELEQARKALATLQGQFQQLAVKYDKLAELQGEAISGSDADALRTELTEVSKIQEQHASTLQLLEEKRLSNRMDTVLEFGKHSVQIEKLYAHLGLDFPARDDNIDEVD